MFFFINERNLVNKKNQPAKTLYTLRFLNVTHIVAAKKAIKTCCYICFHYIKGTETR